MRRRIRINTSTALVAAAATVTLVCGVAAIPAVASNRVTSVIGSAYGYRAYNISLFGGSQSDSGPTPTVTLASNASNSPQNASASCALVSYGPAVLLTTDAISVHSAGSLGTSGSANSTSSVSDINKATNTACSGTTSTGSEIFTADSVSASVTAGISGITASTTITNGTYDVHSNWFNCSSQSTLCGRTGFQTTHPDPNPGGTTSVATNPAPNTKVAGHVHLSDTSEDFYVIVFNEQISNANGSLTVNPVHEYFGATLDGSNNIVDDPTSILQGDLIIGQVIAGVTVK